MRGFRGVSATLAAGALVASLFVTPASAATTQVVRSLGVNGWFALNEGPTGSVGATSLVSGPGAPPLGNGSAQLTVDSTGRASLGTNQFAGQRLDAISGLDYWAYVAGATTNQLVLQFDVDYDATDANTAYQGRLTFVPDAPPVADTWRHLNALTDGHWFASQAPGNSVCTQASMCTWSDILTAFPNAAVRNDALQKGAFLFRLGGPVPGGATGNVDALTLTTSAATTVVDFEPGATITPAIGPAGTAATVNVYGLKPKSRALVQWSVSSRGRRYPLCRMVADGTGFATCAVTIPTGARSGLAGVHTVFVNGHGPDNKRVQYQLDFVLTP